MLLAITSKLLHQILDELGADRTTNGTTQTFAWRCAVRKRCSQKFHKFHRKTPVPESIF